MLHIGTFRIKWIAMTSSNEFAARKGRRRAAPPLPWIVAASLRAPALASLPPRLQEVAAIIYLHTQVTAKQLEAALSHEVDNSTIRTMLRRLIAKGIVRREKGPGRSFVYSPAILHPEVQERALERLADEYFGGSLYQATHRLLALMRRRDPEAFVALSRQLPAGSAGEGLARAANG
jgi:predicted transcriptional regulator